MRVKLTSRSDVKEESKPMSLEQKRYFESGKESEKERIIKLLRNHNVMEMCHDSVEWVDDFVFFFNVEKFIQIINGEIEYE